MTVARTSHDPPLTRLATAPPSLLGGSLLVSALAQFSLSADTRQRHQPCDFLFQAVLGMQELLKMVAGDDAEKTKASHRGLKTKPSQRSARAIAKAPVRSG
jgi:hypothetical protein